MTNKPRLKRMTMAQQEFYLKHPNGVQLLEHVKNLSVGPGAAARRQQEVSPTKRLKVCSSPEPCYERGAIDRVLFFRPKYF